MRLVVPERQGFQSAPPASGCVSVCFLLVERAGLAFLQPGELVRWFFLFLASLLCELETKKDASSEKKGSESVKCLRRLCRSFRTPSSSSHTSLSWFSPPHPLSPSKNSVLRPQKLSTPFPPPILIWLILPVVICLSQRLSHARVSLRTLKPRDCGWLISQT